MCRLSLRFSWSPIKLCSVSKWSEGWFWLSSKATWCRTRPEPMRGGLFLERSELERDWEEAREVSFSSTWLGEEFMASWIWFSLAWRREGRIVCWRWRNFFQLAWSCTLLLILFNNPTPNLSYYVITSYFCHRVRGWKFLTSDSGWDTVRMEMNFLERMSSSEVRAKPCIFRRRRRSRRSRFLNISYSTISRVSW